MRSFPVFLLAAAATVLPGCSLMIENTGIVVKDPATREGIRSQFGIPISVTQTTRIDPDSSEIKTFDVENYHVHAKFNTAMPMGAGSGLILLLDPFLTAIQLYETAAEYLRGHHLAFVYDEDGKTIGGQYPHSFFGTRVWIDDNVLNWKEPSTTNGM